MTTNKEVATTAVPPERIFLHRQTEDGYIRSTWFLDEQPSIEHGVGHESIEYQRVPTQAAPARVAEQIAEWCKDHFIVEGLEFYDDEIDNLTAFIASIHSAPTQPTAPLACTECPHVFTADEIASEDKSAWGHPCHGVTTNPNTVCESHRRPTIETADANEAVAILTEIGDSLRKLDVFQCNEAEHGLDCKCFWERIERWLASPSSTPTLDPVPGAPARTWRAQEIANHRHEMKEALDGGLISQAEYDRQMGLMDEAEAGVAPDAGRHAFAPITTDAFKGTTFATLCCKSIKGNYCGQPRDAAVHTALPERIYGWITGSQYQERGYYEGGKGKPNGEPWYKTVSGQSWSAYDVSFFPDHEFHGAPHPNDATKMFCDFEFHGRICSRTKERHEELAALTALPVDHNKDAEIDHLLQCLSEECSEMAVAVSKCLRFGILDNYTGTQAINYVVGEYNDMLAVIDLLDAQGVVIPRVDDLIQKKKEKLATMMNYAREKGRL